MSDELTVDRLYSVMVLAITITFISVCTGILLGSDDLFHLRAVIFSLF